MTDSIIMAIYTEKYKDKNGRIVGYRIKDTLGRCQDISSKQLKQAMSSNAINILNLKLTVDGRLVDKAVSAHILKDKNLQIVSNNSTLEKASRELTEVAKALLELDTETFYNRNSIIDYADYYCNQAGIEFKYTEELHDNLDEKLYTELRAKIIKAYVKLLQKSSEFIELKINNYEDSKRDLRNAVLNYDETDKRRHKLFIGLDKVNNYIVSEYKQHRINKEKYEKFSKLYNEISAIDLETCIEAHRINRIIYKLHTTHTFNKAVKYISGKIEFMGEISAYVMIISMQNEYDTDYKIAFQKDIISTDVARIEIIIYESDEKGKYRKLDKKLSVMHKDTTNSAKLLTVVLNEIIEEKLNIINKNTTIDYDKEHFINKTKSYYDLSENILNRLIEQIRFKGTYKDNKVRFGTDKDLLQRVSTIGKFIYDSKKVNIIVGFNVNKENNKGTYLVSVVKANDATKAPLYAKSCSLSTQDLLEDTKKVYELTSKVIFDIRAYTMLNDAKELITEINKITHKSREFKQLVKLYKLAERQLKAITGKAEVNLVKGYSDVNPTCTELTDEYMQYKDNMKFKLKYRDTFGIGFRIAFSESTPSGEDTTLTITCKNTGYDLIFGGKSTDEISSVLGLEVVRIAMRNKPAHEVESWLINNLVPSIKTKKISKLTPEEIIDKVLGNSKFKDLLIDLGDANEGYVEATFPINRALVDLEIKYDEKIRSINFSTEKAGSNEAIIQIRCLDDNIETVNLAYDIIAKASLMYKGTKLDSVTISNGKLM